MTSLVRGLRALSVAPRTARWISASSATSSNAAAAAATAATTAAGDEAAALPQFSVVHHKVSDAPIKPEDHFAVIKLGGTQYKVTQGDVVIAEKLKDAKVGEILDLDQVLLLGNVNQTIVGRPLIAGAVVRARVEEQTLDAKIDIFKKKRRKNYRRWNGFRREVTVLRVTDVVPLPETE